MYIMSSSLNNFISEYNGVKNIYAIGDLHGDIFAFIMLLRFCAKVIIFDETQSDYEEGTISENINIGINKLFGYKWTASDTIVVIVGDILDNYRTGYSLDDDDKRVGEIDDEELLIFQFIRLLNKQALNMNSRIIPLFGNHEILNLKNDFRYVTPYALKKSYRKKIFQEYGELFREIGIGCILKINDFIFIHGGISEFINKQQCSLNDVNNSLFRMILDRDRLKTYDPCREIITDEDGILWSRIMGQKQYEINSTDPFTDYYNYICNLINKNDMKCKNKIHIVIAHTPQINISPNSTACDIIHMSKNRTILKNFTNSGKSVTPSLTDPIGRSFGITKHNRVIRIDIAMSKAFDDGPLSYKEYISRLPQLLNIVYNRNKFDLSIIRVSEKRDIENNTRTLPQEFVNFILAQRENVIKKFNQKGKLSCKYSSPS